MIGRSRSGRGTTSGSRSTGDLCGSGRVEDLWAVGVAHAQAGARLGELGARAVERRGRGGSGGGCWGLSRGSGGRCRSGSRGGGTGRRGSLRGAGSSRGGSGSRGGGTGACASAGRSSSASRDRNGLARAGVTAINLEDNNLGLGAVGSSDNTASSTSSTSENIRGAHLVDTHSGRIDTAGKTIAVIAVTLNLDTKLRLDVAERSGGFQVDRVPTNLNVGVATAVSVGTSSVRRPVADRVGVGTPDTTFLDADTRSVDVVLSSGGAPVRHARHGKISQLLNQSWDQHGLVSGEHSLAKSDRLAGLVDGGQGTGTILAVGLAREGLLNLAVLVTV